MGVRDGLTGWWRARPIAAALLVVVVAQGGLATAQPTAPSRPSVPERATAPGVETQLAFLAAADVVASRRIGKGVTGALRVTLRDGTRTHDAAFQSVAEQSTGSAVPKNLRTRGELRFVDHYRYNIASWRLARMLGLTGMMPPTVERTVGGRSGALSWWVDDVLMDEEQRQKSAANPPGGSLALARQFGRMMVFAELVRDTDRNKGNVVFTTAWQLVMLDFTRAFRLQPQLLKPENLGSCDRRLLASLRVLTAPQVKTAVEHHLTDAEIGGVIARRDLLVSHFDRLIAARGEAAILY